jgi:hypothetical protein
MTQSVALPAQPVNPEPIQPPTLTAPTAPGLESPKALLKRSKEVARTIKQFIRENRSMQLTIDGKKYPRAEVWQFGAACLGITAMVTTTQELLNEKQEEIGFLAVAHALNAAGRVISGAEAVCMCSEPEWQYAPSFKLRAMAETRSCSRVLRHVLAYVMVMAGLCPTPAEEMDSAGKNGSKRDLKTPCGKSDCGNSISDKRRTDTRRKYGVALCIPCEKRHIEEKGAAIMAPLSDPAQVAEHIEKVKQRKANGGAQPIVAAMDAGEEEMPA